MFCGSSGYTISHIHCKEKVWNNVNFQANVWIRLDYWICRRILSLKVRMQDCQIPLSDLSRLLLYNSLLQWRFFLVGKFRVKSGRRRQWLSTTFFIRENRLFGNSQIFLCHSNIFMHERLKYLYLFGCFVKQSHLVCSGEGRKRFWKVRMLWRSGDILSVVLEDLIWIIEIARDLRCNFEWVVCSEHC